MFDISIELSRDLDQNLANKKFMEKKKPTVNGGL